MNQDRARIDMKDSDNMELSFIYYKVNRMIF